MTRVALPLGVLLALTTLGFSPAQSRAADPPRLELKKGDRICIIGNTLAERMQYFGTFEAVLHYHFSDLELVVRNLGWSADELTLRPRSKDFKDHGHSLHDHKADVVIAMFGFNESFAGPAGLKKFEADLEKFIAETTKTKYNGKTPPRLALVSPIANEDLPERGIFAGKRNNTNIKLYADAIKRIAAKHKIPYADVFGFVARRPDDVPPLTTNGIHLNRRGYAYFSNFLIGDLFARSPGPPPPRELLAAVNEKNLQFWYDHRAVNGFYIYGGRKKPFGVVNFPEEFKKLRKMLENRDRRIWDIAQGKKVPAKIDDGNTGTLKKIETNFKRPIEITPPDDAIKRFTLPKGYQIELYASEVDFPDLENPCQFAIGPRGQIWVTTMPSYPMYLPGVPVDDKVVILEDFDGDGKANSCRVFADKLHVPTGIELGDGGVYVAQQPNLVHLKDTTGDGKADKRAMVLHGFDSADSHHSISAFTWGPGGALYFQEGTFHHTQVETPYGPTRLVDAGVFRYEPRTEKFDVFVSYRFANPWGHTFDRWGQNFVADASGGANYFGTAFSGDVDYPHKHAGLKHFLKKQWRPTCGCELVSSRHFPDEAQGNYLLNNCIGFQGVLQYRMRDDGSGFAAEPTEPLLRSSDPNFRPVDLEFGPDGALYVLDWFNPLIGHMQHSLRDPNRDKNHGRIWRITYKGRPLVKPPKIAEQPVLALLDLLKEYEDRTRYRVRRELRTRKTAEVVLALKKWIAGLDKKGESYQHHLLEALWVHQHHDAVNDPLLKQLLASPDHRARAAATRVLCYWRDRVEKPLELLRKQINDKHPRVRLEAIRALSFFKGKDAKSAQEIAFEILAHDQDDYLKYTFKETMATLDRRVKALK